MRLRIPNRRPARPSSRGVALALAALFALSAAVAEAQGDLAWEFTYDSPAHHEDAPTAVAIDSERHTIVGGTSFSFATGDDFTIVKIDPAGQLLWERHFSRPGAYDTLSELLLTPDDGVIAVGRSQGLVDDVFALLRYDADGTLLWSHTVAYEFSAASSSPPQLALSTNGTIAVGVTDADDFHVFTFDADGTPLWDDLYAEPGNFEALDDLAIDSAGRVYAAGSGGGLLGGVLVKFTATGGIEWVRSTPGDFAFDIGESRVALDGTESPIAVHSLQTSCGPEARAVRFDPAGNLTWETSYPGAALCAQLQFDAIAVSPDGTTWITGSGGHPGLDDFADAVTVRQQGGVVDPALPWDQDDAIDRGRSIALDERGGAAVVVTHLFGASTPNSTLIRYHADGTVDWSELLAPGPGQVNVVMTEVAARAGRVVAVGQSVIGGQNDIIVRAVDSDAPFLRGDCTGDDQIDVGDAIAALSFLFQTGAPSCESACDANDDGLFDISDPIALLSHLFIVGTPLPAPFPACGPEPTPDALTCASGC